MNIKTLALVTAGSLVAAGSAGAAELSAVGYWDTDNPYMFGDYASTGLQTCELYVSGLEDGESVLSVSGIPGSEMNVTTGDGSNFFNGDEFGQMNGAPSESLFAAFPSLQWDTWLAIGDAQLSVSPGFPDVALAGGGEVIVGEDNAAWFNGNPGEPAFEDDGNVMIGQFTFSEDTDVSFSLNVQIIDASGVERQEYLTASFNHVPAPGAVALLGLAGLAGTRRRRG